MLNRSGKTLSVGKITIGFGASCQRESRNKTTDTYQLRERGQIRLRTRLNERESGWIITIVVVNDSVRYHAWEVVGCYSNGSSAGAASGTLHTDGFDVRCDGGGTPLGRSTTLGGADASASAATCAALLTSWISARWCHRYLCEDTGRGEGRVLGIGSGWYLVVGAKRRWGGEMTWFYRLSIKENHPSHTEGNSLS